MDIRHSSQFKKDYKRIKSQGKDLALLHGILELIAHHKPLPESFRDHALKGNYTGCRECHLTPDWLLIYQYLDESTLYVRRTGSHSELF